MNSVKMKVYSSGGVSYDNIVEKPILKTLPRIIPIRKNWPNRPRTSISPHFESQLIIVRGIIDSLTPDLISTSDLAKQIGTNEHRLKSGFKLLFGMTIFKYSQYVKMRYARRWLETGEKSIKEIAYQSGYSNIANFTNAFKAWHGYPPSSLKAMRNQDSCCSNQIK